MSHFLCLADLLVATALPRSFNAIRKARPALPALMQPHHPSMISTAKKGTGMQSALAPVSNASAHVPLPSSGLGKATVGNSGSGFSCLATSVGVGSPMT